MRISVEWTKKVSGKTAEELTSIIQKYLDSEGVDWIRLQASDPTLSQQHLGFEAENYREAARQAESMRHVLCHTYGLDAFIIVQTVPGRQFMRLDDFAAEQELIAARRLQAMRNAIESLKTMRKWFKDKRVGEIRLRLEQNLY